MTKEELFEKYSVDESHINWEPCDSWFSVEVYRVMHNGNLPPLNDRSFLWVVEFLDKRKNDMPWWVEHVMSRKDWGSLYLTSKRMVYLMHEEILEQLNAVSAANQAGTEK